ncbi:MAG TPA: 4-hydroxy-3-methylbut-2-enyl diphosphate reductase [Tepidiformaceae bacterium]|nr:4-hydroxy-3-methylbut-2-enyl diphosphate reductase [Tepidiformaceae bacterium]
MIPKSRCAGYYAPDNPSLVRQGDNSLRVILANPRGFCAGVNMAIDALDHALKLFGAPVYVYHEIVHNRHVVAGFRQKGAIFVEAIEDVPVGATLVFSAHGISPEVREAAAARQLRVVDATCPLVTKVHSEAARFARHGHTILLIGHAGHDEIVGTMGEAPEQIQLVESAEGVDDVVIPEGSSIAYLSQTTLSVDDASRVVGRLRDRFPNIVAPPSEDICYATQNRQEAVRQLASEADVVLVIGSQNSSNSARLAEIARDMGVPAYLLDSADEINDGWFEGVDTVAITAGASAPEELVQRCLERIQHDYGATIEERTVRTEDMHFQLPVDLRRAMAAANDDLAQRDAAD